MVDAVVSSAVEMLGNLMIQECCFLCGVGNQVEEIQRELVRMKCFLKDADRRSHEEEGVRNWIKSVRNVAYKIENVLETYTIKVESKKGKGVISTLKRYACILTEGVDLHKLGVELGNIKTEIDGITSSRETYDIKFENEGQSSNDAGTNLQRQTFAHDIEEHFVGMEDDIVKLVELMIDRDEGHQIISICGMGGLGKTTLAKKVFNHEVFQNHFDSFAWVTVSQQFEAENVLKDILRKLDTRRGEGMGYGELVEELHKFQREKKCLVVLDDIWKREHWDALHPAFANTSVDCKVLLTTRIQEVAEVGTIHKPKVLSEEEGWELLKKKAFIGKNARDFNLEAGQEKLGKEMVRKCGYLPLAVSVIGGILSKKETLKDWEMVNEDMDSYLRCGEGVENNDQVMQILTLSYEDLPYQLKPCLLYMASFQEDEEIDLQKLYWMWIAEGFISSKDQRRNESLLEVAERYLNELASRSLVQLQFDEKIWRSFKSSCLLHDLIRDLCVSKCEEDDFLKVIDLRKSKQPKYDFNSLEGNAYRLLIYGFDDDGNVCSKILKNANRRARACSLIGDSKIACGVLEDLGNLQFLKIVTFQGLDLSNTKVFHKVIKKLIHLRCLIFEGCELKEVPSSVGELTYLQTFVLICEGLDEVVKIPNVFWKLKKLLHFVLLDVDLNNSPIELRLDFFCGMETLLIVSDAYRPIIKDLSKLTNLRVFDLCVYDNENLSLIIDFMKRKWHGKRDIAVKVRRGCDFISKVDGPVLLHKLFLCHAIQHLEICDVPVNEFPKYDLGMLTDLVYLYLIRNYIKEDPMPTLEKLPKLKELSLVYESFDGEELICSSIGFPNLKELTLSGLCNLKRWRIDDGAMPNLSTVTIWNCIKLEMIPSGMKFLKALTELKIREMPKEFNDRIRILNGEEGADLHKVRHVPSIGIQWELNYEVEWIF